MCVHVRGSGAEWLYTRVHVSTDPQPMRGGSSNRRHPSWSGALTAPLLRIIPAHRRGEAHRAIKAIHTGAFLSVAGALALALWDGLTGRPRRRTAIAGGIVLAESAAFVSNNQVCPLTPLAEELGAERGSVTDIFLPDWLARRTPLVAGSLAVLTLLLNARAWARRSRLGHRASPASGVIAPRWPGR